MHIEIVNDSFYDEEENQDVEVYELILIRDFHKDCDEEVFRLSYHELKQLKQQVDKYFFK